MTTPDENPTSETQQTGDTPTEDIPADTGSTPQSRRALGAALIGGTILAIGAVLASGSGNMHKPESVPTITVPPSSPTIVTRHDPSPPWATPPPTNAPPTLVKPIIRWKGTLTINGPDTHRDLDAIPPRTNIEESDLNGSWLETDIKADSNNVQIAVLHGGTPGYAQCRDAAFTRGSDHTEELKWGDVLCVHTSQGRTARLVTVLAAHAFNDPILEFHATIWDPPTR